MKKNVQLKQTLSNLIGLGKVPSLTRRLEPETPESRKPVRPRVKTPAAEK